VFPAFTAHPGSPCALPKCILIVDDHEHIRRIIRNSLEAETGFEVCGEAIDGYDAIEKAQVLKPDLIILDISMPRMNGIEAARKLKKMLPQTPIVLFTSYHAALSLDMRAAGIDAVVEKEYGMSVLIKNLQDLLQEA
jgi:DNA-binding NarL/FixJ family response regulator